MQLLWDGLVGSFTLLMERDALVLNAAWRSLWISTCAVAIASILGVPFGGWLAHTRFFGRTPIVLIARVGMSLPTVLIGLLCYAMLSRRGPLGSIDLLYTKSAIIVGEFFLAFPIIASWTHSSVRGLDTRVRETAATLGAGFCGQIWTCLTETRVSIMLAVLTAFARCITELGIALMVGGNIQGRTRTLTTATALETSRGEFERGVAMSMVLLMIAMAVTVVVAWLHRSTEEL